MKALFALSAMILLAPNAFAGEGCDAQPIEARHEKMLAEIQRHEKQGMVDHSTSGERLKSENEYYAVQTEECEDANVAVPAEFLDDPNNSLDN